MAGGTIEYTDLGEKGSFLEYTEDFSATGQTDACRFERGSDGVLVQIAGTATSVTAIVERATKDPGVGTPNWAPASDQPISGNLATGVAPKRFIEPTRGWWRVRITGLTGGTASVYMVGERG